MKEYIFKNKEMKKKEYQLNWELVEGQWKLNVKNKNLESFIISELLNGKRKLYSTFLESIEADVKVSLIAETTTKILENLSSINEVDEIEVSKLFISFDNFQKEALNFTSFFGVSPNERDDIKHIIDEYGDKIRFALTKDLMYFYAYSLTYSRNRSILTFEKPLKDYGKLKLRRLSGNYPNFDKLERSDNGILNEAQLTFNDYLTGLNKDNFNFNKSLNFHFFNKFTKLYDVHFLSYISSQESKIADIYKSYSLKEYKEIKKESRYIFKRNLSNEKVHFLKLNGLLTRSLLMKNFFNKEFILKISYNEIYNKFYKFCMVELLKAIVKNNKSKTKKGEAIKGLEKDLYIYMALIKEDPYKSYLEILEKRCEKYHTSIENTKDLIRREHYYYTHEAIYNFMNLKK